METRARYAILGHPLTHSMSPFIHERLFALGGKAADYLIFDWDDQRLSAGREELLALAGCNITIPHKQTVIGLCGELDASAEKYKSVNLIKNDAGKAVGYNTDVYGFLKTIETMSVPLSGKILLLGSGGVGRMFATECVDHGAALTIALTDFNREEAARLKTFLQAHNPSACVTLQDTAEIDGTFDLLINSTPVGMYPHTDRMPVTEKVLSGVGHVFDAIYNPDETLLAKTARALGKQAKTGMSMLVWQAVRAHEIWYDACFAESDIEQLIADSVRYMNRNF